MEFIADIPAADLAAVKLIAEVRQFAIYATSCDAYLLVQRSTDMHWAGLQLSDNSVCYMSSLLAEAARDVREKHDKATERRDLFQDDLTEERQISPVSRDKVAATLMLDPIDGDGETGEPLTGR